MKGLPVKGLPMRELLHQYIDHRVGRSRAFINYCLLDERTIIRKQTWLDWISNHDISSHAYIQHFLSSELLKISHYAKCFRSNFCHKRDDKAPC